MEGREVTLPRTVSPAMRAHLLALALFDADDERPAASGAGTSYLLLAAPVSATRKVNAIVTDRGPGTEPEVEFHKTRQAATMAWRNFPANERQGV